MTIWDQVLEQLRKSIPEEDFRRWFGASAYASDSGDQITVWVPSEAILRHVRHHYDEPVRRVLRALGRQHCDVRFVVSGTDEDEDDDEDDQDDR